MSTKIHALVDALGNPLAFFLTGGQAHDLRGADPLPPATATRIPIADKAYGAETRVLQPLVAAGKTAVIPPRSNRRTPRGIDRERYKARHPIENFFGKLKQFRAIPTRDDKTARNFLAGVQLAVITVWLKRRQALGSCRHDDIGGRAVDQGIGVRQSRCWPPVRA